MAYVLSQIFLCPFTSEPDGSGAGSSALWWDNDTDLWQNANYNWN